MQRPVHDDDGSDHIVLFVTAGFAEPRHVADKDVGHILDLDRHAVRLRKHNVLNVVDVIALNQVVVAAAVQKADAADIDRLLAKTDGTAANVDVGVADRGNDLRQRDVVGVELVQIDLNLKLLGRSAPGVDLNDALDLQQAALHDPILDGAKIGQSEIWRTGNLIAIDFTDQA